MQWNLNHGGAVLTATITTTGDVVGFDQPASAAGATGTVTAEEAADWTEDDWRRLARSRERAVRRTQRRAGLGGPRAKMSPQYAAAVNRQTEARRPKWRVERLSPAEADVFLGGLLVGTWRFEEAPAMGRVWQWYPPGHAFPSPPAADANIPGPNDLLP